MADASFDIVSKVDHQEADNALNQAAKELSQRFDFRGTDATIAWSGTDGCHHLGRHRGALRRGHRGVQGKADQTRYLTDRSFEVGEPAASGKIYRVTGKIVEGIASDKAKVIAKKIRDEAPKGVQAQIQGDQLRVTGKKRDDLQSGDRLAEGCGSGRGPAVHELPLTLRKGLAAAVAAALLWGLFPLYWPLLEPASALEILAHRVVWSLVVMVGVLSAARWWRLFRGLTGRTLGLTALAAVLISVNWGVYIYAVNNGEVIDASLGYFITPLLSVLFGLMFFKERLRTGTDRRRHARRGRRGGDRRLGRSRALDLDWSWPCRSARTD